VVTLILVTALLTLGALAMYLQTADTRSAGYVVDERRSLYCAESGLAGARDYVKAHVAQWEQMLNASASDDPSGYPVTGDLDGDGHADWSVSIKDNDDEFPTNDTTIDSDGVVFMVSTCIAYDDTPSEVMELVAVGGGGTNYRDQAGGGGGNTGNGN
jgi:hypothetical protein